MYSFDSNKFPLIFVLFIFNLIRCTLTEKSAPNVTSTTSLLRIENLAITMLDEEDGSTRSNKYLARKLLRQFNALFPMQQFVVIVGIYDEDTFWSTPNTEWFVHNGLFVMIYFNFAVDFHQGNLSCYGNLNDVFPRCTLTFDAAIKHINRACQIDKGNEGRQIGMRAIFDGIQEVGVASSMPDYAFRHEQFVCVSMQRKKWDLIVSLYQPPGEALHRFMQGQRSTFKALIEEELDADHVPVPKFLFVLFLFGMPILVIVLFVTCFCLFASNGKNGRRRFGFYARGHFGFYTALPNELEPTSIDIESRIYSGPNSRVYLAKYRFAVDALREVVVKVPSKEAFNLSMIEEETRINAQLRHPRIVEYIGYYRDMYDNLRIVSELMKGGDLHSYLANSKKRDVNVGLIFHFIAQIAEGMEYLVNKRIVHRDLAARNCMLNDHCTDVKIADFGLSRQFNADTTYSASNPMRLPVRWTAIECLSEDGEMLLTGKFSEKSDIWAFGVLIWECFSRGALPYGGATEFWKVLCRLREDQQNSVVWRLARPKHCPPALYDQLMMRCWQRAPEDRPTFARVQFLLDELFSALILECPDICCEEITFEEEK